MRLLVVDDEPKMCEMLKEVLEAEDYQVETSSNGAEGVKRVSQENFDIIICDLKMPGMDGLEVLDRVKKAGPELEVIIMTAYASVSTAVSAMQRGAYDYIIKPFDSQEMILLIKRIAEKKHLIEENIELKTKLKKKYRFKNLICSSSKMQEVLEMVEKVAKKDATVLIRGETGVGKELIARAIHYESPRRDNPFVAVHCASFPETLLESELFGHEKGAFTSAYEKKIGRFELAREGTIFLDEIGEISLVTQVKLLRVLQEKEIMRLGGEKVVKVNARVIAATNKNLEEALANKEFRQDIYYRLNVFPVFVPPLRQRKEDIPELINYFLKKLGYEQTMLTPQALYSLANYNWPGNVRELENIVERAAILTGEGKITLEHLPSYLREKPWQHPLELEIPDEGISLDEVERQLLLKALDKTNGNRSMAAKLLGITRRGLYSKLKRFRLMEVAPPAEVGK